MKTGTCVNCGRVIHKGLEDQHWSDLGDNIICDANLNQEHIDASDTDLLPEDLEHLSTSSCIVYEAQGDSPCTHCREMIHTGDLVLLEPIEQKLYCTRECFDQVPHGQQNVS